MRTIKQLALAALLVALIVGGCFLYRFVMLWSAVQSEYAIQNCMTRYRHTRERCEFFVKNQMTPVSTGEALP
jgi:hypothetical protein